jgi:geranylgeranyl pyrophosphate synthase
MQRFTTASGTIGEAAAYHLSSGGKRWRPLFLLAVGEALRCDVLAVKHLAAAIELLHNASLVHDDLIDRDTVRRGKETVWRRFGPETAINLGDFLITSTYVALSHIRSQDDTTVRLISRFAESSHQVIEGQSAEMAASRRLDTGLDDYRRIAFGKSGVLMALPVVAVLTLADAASDIIADARQAMAWLGVAYQIQDDIFDLYGLKNGRPAGVDLREGRMSLPTVLFNKIASRQDREAFERFISSRQAKKELEVRYWVDRLRRSSAVAQCKDEFDFTIQRATDHMRSLPEPLLSVIACGKEMILNKKIENIFSRPTMGLDEPSGIRLNRYHRIQNLN